MQSSTPEHVIAQCLVGSIDLLCSSYAVAFAEDEIDSDRAPEPAEFLKPVRAFAAAPFAPHGLDDTGAPSREVLRLASQILALTSAWAGTCAAGDRLGNLRFNASGID